MKISYKSAIIIVSVSMVSLVILGLFCSIYANYIIKQEISNQLRSISTLKENQLNSYVDESKDTIETLASDPLVVWYMRQFIEVHNSGIDTNATLRLENFLKSNPQYRNEFSNESSGETELQNLSQLSELEEFFEDKVSEHFNDELNHTEFNELYILTLRGVIDLSTVSNDKGKIKSEEPYFINGLNSTYVQNFYMSISTREPAMTVSTPIYSDDGQLLGVLAGNLRLDKISQIMIERPGLGNTGETIIINKNHLLVSESRFISDIAFKKTIYTKGVNECLAGNSGIKTYPDYRNVNIIGFFAWIPEREVCLETKKDLNEIYSSLNNIYIILLIFGLFILLLSIILAYILSKSITKSINTLVEGTEQWNKGNFDYIIETTSDDEIAVLCKAFNNVSKELLHSKELEKNYTRNLKK
jgi:hypothetical protein